MTFGRGGREGRESAKQKERKRKEQLEEKFRRKLFRDDERGLEDEGVPGGEFSFALSLIRHWGGLIHWHACFPPSLVLLSAASIPVFVVLLSPAHVCPDADPIADDDVLAVAAPARARPSPLDRLYLSLPSLA